MEPNVLSQPGWVLYSSYTTLVRGDYYFLGVNPAGSGEDPPKTVQYSLDGLTGFTEEAGKNQFLNVPWHPEKLLPLQERFQFLFKKEHSGVDPETGMPGLFCAS
jgi:hypothetical protein